MKNFKTFLVFSVLLVPLIFAVSVSALDRQQAFVEEVLSGDTVRLKGGKTLKYAGIEAPPLQHILPLVRVYGENAKLFNASLVLKKNISIEWGKRLRDSHNHLIGYVYLQDGTFVNLEILKAGHAKPRIVPPDVNHSDLFKKAGLSAERNRLGLWKEAPKNPYLQMEYIGEKNTKVYYLPNSPELARIPQANLVSFRSRVEAKAAGYKACRNCREKIPDGDPESLY